MRSPTLYAMISLVRDVLDMIHRDVCGKLLVPLLGGPLYLVSFIGDHARDGWKYAIKHEPDVF